MASETLFVPPESIESPGPDSIEKLECTVDDEPVVVVNDPYSDRIRCDHPDVDSPRDLSKLLKSKAAEFDRDRVVALVDPATARGLEEAGFASEGLMPGFYRGEEACEVMGWAPHKSGLQEATPEANEHTSTILEQKRGTAGLHSVVDTELAELADAPAIAELLGETFNAYPTPSSDPEYVANEIAGGTPFRVVREDGQIAACASADIVHDARTAELTDCATRPECRGRGWMQAILRELMNDLRDRDFPTAFTLARASIPGVNIAFQRLGFKFRGRMARSCRIGDGLEDMNIWSRRL